MPLPRNAVTVRFQSKEETQRLKEAVATLTRARGSEMGMSTFMRELLYKAVNMVQPAQKPRGGSE